VQPGTVPGDVCRAVVVPICWKLQTGGTRATANIKLSEQLIVEPPPARRQRLGVNHDQSG
jgi:hypothetical protein